MAESIKIDAPPEGLNADDLATTLLYHMQVGRNQANMLAAAEALRIKSSQKTWTVAKAYIHIVKRWTEYKQSEHYRSKFRRGAAGFLNEGDYDNPDLWGGSSSPCPEREKKRDLISEMKEWRKDRELHPENYVSLQEVDQLFKKFANINTKKRMPAKLPDIRPMTINPERNWGKLQAQAEQLMQKAATKDCSTVGSRHTLSEQNNGPEQDKVLE